MIESEKDVTLTGLTQVTPPASRVDRGAVEGALSHTMTTETARVKTGKVVKSLEDQAALRERRIVVGKIAAALAAGEGETDKLAA